MKFEFLQIEQFIESIFPILDPQAPLSGLGNDGKPRERASAVEEITKDSRKYSSLVTEDTTLTCPKFICSLLRSER